MKFNLIKAASFIFAAVLCAGNNVYAQDQSQENKIDIEAELKKRVQDSTLTFSLDEALTFALKRDIDIKNSYQNALIASTRENQTKYNYIPNVSASVNFDVVQGLTFDQTTGQLFQQTTRGSNPSIGARINLFEGNRKPLLRRQAKMNTESALQDIENQKINTQLDVISTYLNVLSAQEDKKVIATRIELINKQLERTDKRVKAGVANAVEIYNIKSRLANEERSIVEAENRIQSQKILLIQALQLKGVNNIKLVDIDDLLDPEVVDIPEYGTVISKSKAFSPMLKGAVITKNSAINDVALAKADRLPTLGLSAGIATRYSSNNPFEVGKQLSDNQSEFVGLNLSVPIFSQFRNNTNIKVSQMSVKSAELNYANTELQLTNTVQSAYFNTVAAQSNYIASKESLISLEESFGFTEKSFERGASDFISYFESLNNKSQGEIALAQSKLTFTLRMKILEVLMGEVK